MKQRTHRRSGVFAPSRKATLTALMTVAVFVVALIAFEATGRSTSSSASGSSHGAAPASRGSSAHHGLGNPAKSVVGVRSARDLKKLTPVEIDKQAAREDALSSGITPAPRGTWRFGLGATYLVGRGIPPGTYHSAAPRTKCSWARLIGAKGAPGDIIAAHTATGSSSVTILVTDKFFLTTGCEYWHKI